MKVLYVSREYPPSARAGGIASALKDCCGWLAEHGHSATVICAADDTRASSESVIDGVNVIRIPGGDFAIRGVEWQGGFVLTRHLRQLCRYHSYRRAVAAKAKSLSTKGGIDLIEFAEFGYESLFWLRQTRSIPTVVRCHVPSILDRLTGGLRLYRGFARLYHDRDYRELDGIRGADVVTACSHALADWVERAANLPGNSILRIPNSVNSTEPPQDTSLTSPKEDARSIVFAGTISKSKGVHDLVEAAKQLFNQGTKFNLTLIGKMTAEGYDLQRRVSQSSTLQQHVVFHAHMPRSKLFGSFARATVCCFPSWWEGLSLAVLEALMLGCVVVACDAPGTNEIIRHGVDGFLAAPRDPRSLADTLSKALNLSDMERRKIQAAAKNRIKTTFDPDVVMPKMLEAYAKAIEDKKTTRDSLGVALL